MKAVLRDLDVVFVADEKGLTIRPSKRQDRLDRRMGWITRLAFLLSWKGGQWARWTPMVAWRDIRRVAIYRNSGEILVTGGAWDIRLCCSPEMSEQVLALIHERTGREAMFETSA